MKKILFILFAAQFFLAPYMMKSYGANAIEDNNVYSMGNQGKRTVKKDILGNLTIEDDKGNRKTVREDIFGNTIIEDNEGNRKTVKEDIFGNTIIEDNKGNRTTIKKDIFGNTIIESY